MGGPLYLERITKCRSIYCWVDQKWLRQYQGDQKAWVKNWPKYFHKKKDTLPKIAQKCGQFGLKIATIGYKKLSKQQQTAQSGLTGQYPPEVLIVKLSLKMCFFSLFCCSSSSLVIVSQQGRDVFELPRTWTDSTAAKRIYSNKRLWSGLMGATVQSKNTKE